MNLSERAFKGLGLTLLTKVLTQSSQFIFGLILARLLSPSDYGLTGVLAIFIAVSELLITSGFGIALLQKKEPTQSDYSTVFIFNITSGIVLYFCLFALAPFIADFYGKSELNSLTKILCLCLLFDSFGSIQGRYLHKNLRFELTTKIYLSAIAASGVIGVIFAWRGFGVWSLVAKQLTFSACLNIGWWIFNSWKPQIAFSFQSFKRLFKVGSNVLFNGLIDTIYNNIYPVIIGKIYSTQELGYYTRGLGFKKIQETFHQSISEVSFPVLSYIQDDKERLAASYRRIMRISSFTLFPIVTIMICTANPMVSFLLTDKWLPAVPLIRILSLSSLVLPFNAVNGNVLYVTGKTKNIFYSGICEKVVFITSILFIYRLGIVGLAWGFVGNMFFGGLIKSFYARRVLPYTLNKQVKDVFPSILLCTLSAGTMHLFRSIIDNTTIQFFILPLAGVIVYYSAAKISNRSEILEIKNILARMMASSPK